jgi:hypothetical protein
MPCLRSTARGIAQEITLREGRIRAPSPRFCGHRLSGLAFCLIGSDIEPLVIVVAFNVGKQVTPGSISAFVASLVHELGFNRAKAAFHWGIVSEWLSVHDPDMAILDVVLQDGNSAGLAKKLCGREVPFLVVSGYSAESEGIDEIFKSAPWLQKPVTAAALESALRSLIAS